MRVVETRISELQRVRHSRDFDGSWRLYPFWNLTPGPDTAYILGAASRRSFRPGSPGTRHRGKVSFILRAAALGSSALLATSAIAFTVVKVIGGAYLILSASDCSCSGSSHSAAGAGTRRLPQLRQISRMSRKVALFFLAFLPRSVYRSGGSRQSARVPHSPILPRPTGTTWCLILPGFPALGERASARTNRLALWLNRSAGSLAFSSEPARRRHAEERC